MTQKSDDISRAMAGPPPEGWRDTREHAVNLIQPGDINGYPKKDFKDYPAKIWEQEPIPDDYYGHEGVQPIDLIRDRNLNFFEGNVVKYIVRWRDKDGVKDLYKAKRYLDWLIEIAETEEQRGGNPVES